MTISKRSFFLSTLLAACLLPACSGGDEEGPGGGSPSGVDAGTTSEVDGGGGGGGGEEERTGLDGMCDHYKECGGTYYSSAQDCIDASIDYWGECEQDTLDAFGDCMMTIECQDWNPDTYNPANTVCSEEWSHVGEGCQ